MKTVSYSADRVCVGDVVALQDGDTLMTVERVDDTPFGLTLHCCWFDPDRDLRFGFFPARRLDLFPSNPWAGALRRGTIVRLKSQGPQMQVVRAKGRGQNAMVLCQWSAPDGQSRRRHFHRRALADAMEPAPFIDSDQSVFG